MPDCINMMDHSVVASDDFKALTKTIGFEPLTLRPGCLLATRPPRPLAYVHLLVRHYTQISFF